MRILYKRPPFWRILKIFFPDYDPDGYIGISFGKVCYANYEIPPDYTIHESIHCGKQQKNYYIVAVLWWIVYLFSKRFRYSQELQAFGEQYKWILKNWPHQRSMKLLQYATGLSSPLYGSMVNIEEAKNAILLYVKEN